jgi:hypothetical protein
MTTPQTPSNTTIKHLVISSGGPAGHMMYSILRTLNVKGIWDFKNIRSIYGSSIGSYIAIILSLQYDWSVIDDYLIKRPWEKVFTRSSGTLGGGGGGGNGSGSTGSNHHETDSNTTFSGAKSKIENILRFYNNHGVYGLKEFTETLRPVLQGKDISVQITLREFFEKTGVELHFIVTEINKYCVIDFNYKTHPNQSLVEACYMSCCYRSEFLGIKMLWETKPANLTEKSSVLQFISTFFNQIRSNFFENRVTRAIPNEVVCVSKVFSLQDWLNWVKDENYRRELVLRGETFANVFLSYRRNYHESYFNTKETENTVLEKNDIMEQSPNTLIETDPVVSTDHDAETAETAETTVLLGTTTTTTTFEIHNTDDVTMV